MEPDDDTGPKSRIPFSATRAISVRARRLGHMRSPVVLRGAVGAGDGSKVGLSWT